MRFLNLIRLFRGMVQMACLLVLRFLEESLDLFDKIFFYGPSVFALAGVYLFSQDAERTYNLLKAVPLAIAFPLVSMCLNWGTLHYRLLPPENQGKRDMAIGCIFMNQLFAFPSVIVIGLFTR